MPEQDFFQSNVDRVELIRQALRTPGKSQMTALTLFRGMTLDEQQQLFPELIQMARAAHGPIGAVREMILSLPRDWVLTHIGPLVETILAGEEYDDYWMFLELYEQLDMARAIQLARRAADHANLEIRELGLEWLAERAATDGPGSA